MHPGGLQLLNHVTPASRSRSICQSECKTAALRDGGEGKPTVLPQHARSRKQEKFHFPIKLPKRFLCLS